MAEEKSNFRYIVRIANTDLDGNRSIGNSMLKIKGVGPVYANMVCKLAGVNKRKKTGELMDQEIEQIQKVIENPKVAGTPSWMFNRRKDYETGEDKHLLGPDLKYVQDNDLRRLQKIKSNRGLRHSWGLPVRGQRTRSNFRKSKGKAVGVKRAKPAQSKKKK